MNISKLTLTTLLIGLISCLITRTGNAQSLESQLKKHVPQIIKLANEKGYKSIGVLKFRTKKAGEKLTDQAGPINSLMADRLECALILENPFDENTQLKIIKDASEHLVANKSANHLTAEGRKACFANTMELAWSDQKVKPDALLTGIIQLQENGKRVTVGILGFDKSGSRLQPFCDIFEADLDANIAAEMGESFVIRAGGVDSELIKSLTRDLLSSMNTNKSTNTRPTQNQVQQIKNQAAVRKSQQVRNQSVPFPLIDPNAPVKLTAIYDGNPVTVQVRNGQAFLPEPRQGQKIEFLLQRGDNVKGRVAVVLKVNGENTLFRQTCRDFDCTKWLLSDKTKSIKVSGYQIKGVDELQEFKVLSQSESQQRAINYGRFAGQIHMTVFQELPETTPAANPQPQPQVEQSPKSADPEEVDEADEDMLAMMRAMQPQNKPKNLGALKQQLRRPEAGMLATRGLIVQGERKKSTIRRNKVQLDPTPIMAVTIRYYTPTGN